MDIIILPGKNFNWTSQGLNGGKLNTYVGGEVVTVDNITGQNAIASGIAVVPTNIPAHGFYPIYDTTGQILQGLVDGAGNLFTTNKQYDVCVYGASFSGCLAAISASRAGGNVILVNDRVLQCVGGMVANGIQYTDAYNYLGTASVTIKRLVKEFYSRAAKYYGLQLQNYYWSNDFKLESHVALQIILAMLKEAKVTIVNNAPLQSVTLNPAATTPTIQSITCTNAGTINASVFIDAHYCGDLLAAAGVPFLVGRDAATTYGEIYATYQAGIITQAGGYIPAVDPYNTPATPSSGTIPYVNVGPMPAGGSADPLVQAMGYRLSLNKDASRIPFYTLWNGTSNNDAGPPWWNNPAQRGSLAQLELLRRYIIAYPTGGYNGSSGTTLAHLTDVFRLQTNLLTSLGITTKFDANTLLLFSLDYIHPESTEYVTATPARRAVIEQNIKQHTIGFIYFMLNLTTIPGIAAAMGGNAAALSADFALYGLSPDEYQGNNYLPYMPYIREGRRMVSDVQFGNTTPYNQLTAAHLVNGSFAADPSTISIAYYTFDTHCSQYIIRTDGTLIAEGNLSNSQNPSNALIPAKVMFPPAAAMTNLLVSVCAAFTHVAWASIRVEPCVGEIGESAGIYAYLAAKQGVAVQNVSQVDARKIADFFNLWSDNGVTLTTDGTISGTGTGNGVYGGNSGTVVSAGTWSAVTTVAAYGVPSYLSSTATTGTNALTLTPALKQSGVYDIYLCWHDAGATTQGTPTTRGTPTIAITANGVTSTFTENESSAGEGGGNGFYAGRYNCNKNGTNNIVLTSDNSGGGNGLVWAKWVPVDGVAK